MNEDWFDEAELKSFYEEMFSKEESILVDERKATDMNLESNNGNLEDSVVLIDRKVEKKEQRRIKIKFKPKEKEKNTTIDIDEEKGIKKYILY